MNQTDRLKDQLLILAKKLPQNAGDIYFSQEPATPRHMSFNGGNGRLMIQPSRERYRLGLSGISLRREMTPFLERICGSKGRLKQGREIFWVVDDFKLVEKAVFRYAKTKT